MKMGDRKLKRLDAMGVKIANKPKLTAEPANRRERRALERAIRRKEVALVCKNCGLEDGACICAHLGQ